MRIPTWRLALTGGAIIALAAAGLGFAAASNTPATAPAANIVAAAPTPGPAAGSTAAGAKDGLRAGRLLRAARRLVHADVTIVGKDGQLVHIQRDHGTIQSIGNGTLTISEAGGGTETVSTNDATKVFLGLSAGKLTDVKVGAEVLVRSLVDGGTTLAKRILVLPATAT